MPATIRVGTGQPVSTTRTATNATAATGTPEVGVIQVSNVVTLKKVHVTYQNVYPFVFHVSTEYATKVSLLQSIEQFVYEIHIH